MKQQRRYVDTYSTQGPTESHSKGGGDEYGENAHISQKKLLKSFFVLRFKNKMEWG